MKTKNAAQLEMANQHWKPDLYATIALCFAVKRERANKIILQQYATVSHGGASDAIILTLTLAPSLVGAREVR